MLLPVISKFKRPATCSWSKRYMQMKSSDLYKKCYQILGVEENSDQNTVRKAYIDLVKRVHPDSGHAEACNERFQQVDNAFKVLQEKFARNRRNIPEDEEEDSYDINHTAPQHRQYLNFDGVGIGTPYQREKQYHQIRAMKAQERVLLHRVDKEQVNELSVTKKGIKHDIKTKYGFERVVEDLIQEAMSKGDFENLPGAGKPLTSAQQQNPYIDFTTHKLNKILLDNGFTPEWIALSRDIRDAVVKLKHRLQEERTYFGNLPLSAHEEHQWQSVLRSYEDDVQRINKNIDKYNLIVPIMENQYFRLNLKTIAREVMEDPLVPRNIQRNDSTEPLENSNTHGKKSDFLSLLGNLFS